MKIGDNGLANPPAAATIGFFDGVHLGHRFLIGQVCREARARGLASLAVTFPEPPRAVLCPGFRPELLATPQEKLSLLEQTGVEYCALLPFTRQMAALSARQFMQLLKERFRIRLLVVGYDHRFGHDRAEGFDDYVRHGRELGMDVLPAEAYRLPGWTGGGVPPTVSSSLIRHLLVEGDVERAAACLGYRYSLGGTVAGGRRIGRELGFPTANLRPDNPCKLVPADGVYAVTAQVDGRTYGGMLNIGRRPTLDNGDDRSIEAHLFDFDHDIYGHPMRLTFVRRIRPERKYASLDELTAQLRHDEEEIRALLADGAL